MALRFQNNYDFQDVPIPTSTARQPPRTGATIKRAKTLTRPERSVAPVPLITPAQVSLPTPAGAQPDPQAYPGSQAWRIASRIITFWAPDFLLSSLGGLKDAQVRQAWREKISLCFIIAVLCGCVGFATVGFQKVLCPASGESDRHFIRVGSAPNTLGILGQMFNVTDSTPAPDVDFRALAAQSNGQDITPLFSRTASLFSLCQGLPYRIATEEPCSSANPCLLPSIAANSTFQQFSLRNTNQLAGYDWDQVAGLRNYMVLDGAVLNLTPYLSIHTRPIPGDNVDKAIRTVMARIDSGRDATRLFTSREDLKSVIPCMKQRYLAGNIDKITPGCFASSLMLYAGLIVILALVLVRFAMACVFNWFMSSRLAGPPTSQELNRSAISPAVMPEGANVSVDNKNGTAPWANPKKLSKPGNPKAGVPRSIASSASSATLTNNDGLSPVMSLTQIGAELFAVCLVTCYSEGEESLRTTLDSISSTTYSDARKLLFVVADGMITGAGEKRSTPDICVSLLEADPRFGNPIPMAYGAVGSGAKANNRAMVYAGHYTVAGRRTPTVIVVKCGTEQEALHDKKPGNRGKRDSQLILMNFFSRVTYNDRMTPLDFDLFRKIHVLMGVTPDFFEVCLMVDADTKVFPDSLGYLVNCMHHDQMIMGVCGETRIANKRQSWVTAIQVFEYFISHHLAKAFESVFGGVSCLPGCFSMFRLKARKASGDDWVPLIIKPEIVKEYSQSEVITLHQKNLLLLGEDRFLTTILLRTFPNRKMMFLPQAKCRTIVPDTFPILLSQRRRWINSTIHNLMELVLVRNLCGTFCFSMQFVVFMDLLGTVVLPIAIALTYSLVIASALNPPKNFEQAIPLLLLVSVLGLPAILILITTRKVIYVFWMLIYLFALPVWNFVLPLYAFWHFDDFSWGETRKVEGEGKDTGHGDGGGVASAVPMRRWEDWERSRLRKIKREERRRRDLERSHPGGLFTGGERGEYLVAPDTRSQYGDSSDTFSVNSSDDDHWGSQIGGYNENNAQFPPPPVALFTPHKNELDSAKTVDASELEAMLESGFDDRPTPPASVMRYQLSDGTSPIPPAGGGNGYVPLNRAGSPGQPQTPSALSPTTPAMTLPNDSSNWSPPRGPPGRGPPQQQRYGPLGPLDPSTKF
ncbi:chitin synthase 1 [Coprinopsis cinerea okayama7|uniref:chitin synthase n=1 Tax=Coprinopsis cinerea (strain Okayama-7 / 130 / ATCC MYA-4618 / FGSC 9003) TaxID=240176 RepID=A8N6M9_COPC7|nr:chitin synthase 1 [Coprinopsis cinerea okayama7\|eukprot:XP_001830485.2 chitin synthase 1 [Coprinopsis cinerea okayama7\